MGISDWSSDVCSSDLVSTCGGARRSSDHTDEPARCAARSHSAQSTALRAAPAGSSSASCAREAPLAIACRADSICCSFESLVSPDRSYGTDLARPRPPPSWILTTTGTAKCLTPPELPNGVATGHLRGREVHSERMEMD